MIPRPSVLTWEDQKAPRSADWQIEHDLMMSRVLVEIFSHEQLSKTLMFRGGTALGKLHFDLPQRFSEDLDLVQIESEPIKDSIQYPLLHEVMDKLPLELAKYGPSDIGYSYFFDFEVWDPAVEKSRLKVEINTREHFTLLDPEYLCFEVSTDWFEGTANVKTYPLIEILAHKLLSLYDRKKGRDLFDLWYATREDLVDSKRILSCYKGYIKKARQAGTISRAEFERNLSEKIRDTEFRNDIRPLLREGIEYNIDRAAWMIYNQYIKSIGGDPYRGEDNFFVKEETEDGSK